mmetsp:Transcript_43434/g.113050  ORF Transcript_43434/g.113050 Transcript_43434/m.113050 type:complete len:231 (-) Transcript_43434:1452-2144(-)
MEGTLEAEHCEALNSLTKKALNALLTGIEASSLTGRNDSFDHAMREALISEFPALAGSRFNLRRILYFPSADCTLFGEADWDALVENVSRILSHAAENSLSAHEVVASLEGCSLSAEARNVIGVFWRKEGGKISSHLRTLALWRPTIKKIQWRADLQARVRERPLRIRNGGEEEGNVAGMGAEVNSASAIIELSVGKRSEVATASFQFELDKRSATMLLSVFDEVDSVLA